MRAMGIDPSTKTGIAITESPPHPEIHPLTVYTEEVKTVATGFQRLSYIAERVMAIYAIHKPEVVIIEGYALYNVTGIVPVVEVGTVIRYFLWQEDIKYYECNPATLKKFVAGTGKAKKDQMMLNVFKRWGFEGTDNECDAVGLAMYGLAHPNGPPEPVKKPKKKKGLLT